MKIFFSTHFCKQKKKLVSFFDNFILFATTSILFCSCTSSILKILLDREIAELLYTLLLLCSWTVPLLQLRLQYLLCSCAGITLRPLGLSPLSQLFSPLLLLLDTFSASLLLIFFFLSVLFSNIRSITSAFWAEQSSYWHFLSFCAIGGVNLWWESKMVTTMLFLFIFTYVVW